MWLEFNVVSDVDFLSKYLDLIKVVNYFGNENMLQRRTLKGQYQFVQSTQR